MLGKTTNTLINGFVMKLEDANATLSFGHHETRLACASARELASHRQRQSHSPEGPRPMRSTASVVFVRLPIILLFGEKIHRQSALLCSILSPVLRISFFSGQVTGLCSAACNIFILLLVLASASVSQAHPFRPRMLKCALNQRTAEHEKRNVKSESGDERALCFRLAAV